MVEESPPSVEPVTLNMVHERQRLDVQVCHAKVLEVFDGLEKVETKHAVKFFTDVQKKDKEGSAQQQRGFCIACNLGVTSTGNYRFHTHLISCVMMRLSLCDLRASVDANLALE